MTYVEGGSLMSQSIESAIESITIANSRCRWLLNASTYIQDKDQSCHRQHVRQSRIHQFNCSYVSLKITHSASGAAADSAASDTCLGIALHNISVLILIDNL